MASPVSRVSAIITTFNRAELLRGAIASVLGQTFRDFELIILDNSSADHTRVVLAGIDDPRARCLTHPPLTIAQSRNLGLREARGEYVAFLDDDDEWLPGKLECQLARFEESPATLGLVYGGFVRIDASGRELGTHRPRLRGKVQTALLWQKDAFTGSASNPMMRTAAIQAVGGFDDSLSASEDWELYLRLTERYDVGDVSDVVVRIRTHPGARLGDRIGDARKVEEVVLSRYGPGMGPRLKSFYLRKIGGKLLRLGAARDGRARLLQAIRSDPLNPLGYVQYGLSYAGPEAYERLHRWYKWFLRTSA